MLFIVGFCIIFGSLALLVFVSTKILVWGGLRHLYLKAGALGAVYGLSTTFLFAYLRSICVPLPLYEYFMFAPATVQSQAAVLNAEGSRLAFQLTLLESGPDFIIKGIILVIGITYALKHSGIPWFNGLSQR